MMFGLSLSPRRNERKRCHIQNIGGTVQALTCYSQGYDVSLCVCVCVCVCVYVSARTPTDVRKDAAVSPKDSQLKFMPSLHSCQHLNNLVCTAPPSPPPPTSHMYVFLPSKYEQNDPRPLVCSLNPDQNHYQPGCAEQVWTHGFTSQVELWRPCDHRTSTVHGTRQASNKRVDRLHLHEWETVGCGGWWHGVLFIFLNCLFCIGVQPIPW